MKRNLGIFLLAVALLFTGCGWMDGSYVHITDHMEQGTPDQDQNITVSSYSELENVLAQMVCSGTPEGLIYLSDYAQNMAENAMFVVSRRITTNDPIGAYALEDIQYEIGSNGGKPAIAVKFSYRHTPTELQEISYVRDIHQAGETLGHALASVQPGLVMLVEQYEAVDFAQMAEDYGFSHPQTVMEIPHVTASVHGTGESRVVELAFTYRSSRDALKHMRQQVEPIFEAAKLYVSEDSGELQQYTQLYSFLMERFSEYRIQSSITPAYSLLHHGVGDSRAFAIVYEAMCRSVGLDCRVINGTRDGEPFSWNLINLGGLYCHVDLLQSSEAGDFHLLAKEEMEGYVWDYSSAPESASQEEEQEALDALPAETAVPENIQETKN